MKRRLAVLLLCGCAAVSVAGQATRAQERFRVNPALQFPPPPEPEVLKMPDVRWLTPQEAAIELRERLHRVPAFAGDGPVVVAQDPLPGADVGPNTLLTVTLGVPKLSLSASNANPTVGEEVTFTAALDPPMPKATYIFTWNDGSDDTATVSPAITHRFAEAAGYDVVVNANVPNAHVDPAIVTIAVVAPPPTDTTDTTVTTTTTAVDTGPISVDTTPTIVQPPPIVTPTPVQPPPPSPIPWLMIALIAAAVLAAGATARALRRKPTVPAAAPAVAIRSGLGSTEHTIENPEQVRNGLSLRLRGGVRV